MSRKYKRGLDHEIGDEVSFYLDGVVRSGTITFVGSGSISVVPSTEDILGANGDPLQDKEYNIDEGDIL